MPTPTPELGLSQALDADDTADYLVTNLANSLTTVDSLFNNTTGHTHAGAHQGGPITSAGVANGSITNVKLGPDVARPNLLVNGGFEQWQRGNSFNLSSGTTLTADRWQLSFGGASIALNRTAASTFDATKAGYCASMTVTSWTAHCDFLQLLNDVIPALSGMTVSFSMRIWCSAANAVRLGINDSVNGDRWGAYHPGGNTTQTLTVTAPIASGPTVLAVKLGIDNNCTIYADDGMLVVGSQPANYVPLHPADDLARCQRYYKRFAATSSIALGSGHAYGAGNFLVDVLMSPQMAVVPSVTVSAPGDWQVYNASASPAGACSSLAGNVLHAQSCQLIGAVASGLVAGNSTWLQNVSGNSWLAFEANP